MTKSKNQVVKLSNVVVLDSKTLTAIANGETVKPAANNDVKPVDLRHNNPGRPVNKKSARYKRLAKQAFYNKVNKLFVSGKAFTTKNQSVEYKYRPNADGDGGCLYNGIGSHECNINYIGRTKVTGYTFVLDKRVSVELNLKQVKFVK